MHPNNRDNFQGNNEVEFYDVLWYTLKEQKPDHTMIGQLLTEIDSTEF